MNEHDASTPDRTPTDGLRPRPPAIEGPGPWTWRTWAHAIGGGIFGGAGGAGLTLLWHLGHHVLAVIVAAGLAAVIGGVWAWANS